MQQISQQRQQRHQITKKAIFHNHIASNSQQTIIVTLFDFDQTTLTCHKIMHISENKYLQIMDLCLRRAEILKQISKVRQYDHLFLSYNFQQNIGFQREEIEKQKVLFRIKQPYIRGKTLAQCIRQQNSDYNKSSTLYTQTQSCYNKFSFIKNLIANLINLFIRFKRSALVIPTFRTIIFDPSTQHFNINLFSFIGTGMLLYDEQITENQVKQILSFLSISSFKDRRSQVNLPKALAVLVLGVFLGKEIDLITSKDAIPDNKEELQQLVKRNSQKFQNILKSQRLKQQIEEFQRRQNIRLHPFLQSTLVQQRQLSWAQCKLMLSSFKDIKQGVQSSSFCDKQSEYQKIEIWLEHYANFKWPELSTQQRLFYIRNKIVSMRQPSPSLKMKRLEDIQMFLVVFLNFDLTQAKLHLSLTQYLLQLQSKHSSSFNSKVMQHLHSSLSRFLEQPTLDGYAQKSAYFCEDQEEGNQKDVSNIQVSSQEVQLRLLKVEQRQPQIQQRKAQNNNQKQRLLPRNQQCYEKKKWLVENYQTIFVEPQIHKTRCNEKEGLVKIESRRLQQWRQYQRLFSQ